ncbi:MAG: hypothetical protein GC189_11935 [Alphaproteobacteria bacterium]|nr:hypothetical protein [Alphaproteobacteria bacterium]
MNSRSQLPVFEYRPVEDVRAEVAAILEREPELSSYGFGKFRPSDDLAAMRADALTESSCQEFEKAIAWLSLMKPTASLNRHATSYGYKHEVERWFAATYQGNSYVANGMLIAAALHLGLRVRRAMHNGRGTPNAYINLPQRRPDPAAGYRL